MRAKVVNQQIFAEHCDTYEYMRKIKSTLQFIFNCSPGIRFLMIWWLELFFFDDFACSNVDYWN